MQLPGAGHPLRVGGSRVCKMLARVGTDFPTAQHSDQFVFSPGQGTRRSTLFLQKPWQWACASLQAPAVGSWLWSCSAQKTQPFQSLVLTDIRDKQSPSSQQCSVPLSSCETHAGSEVWIVERSQWFGWKNSSILQGLNHRSSNLHSQEISRCSKLFSSWRRWSPVWR